MKTIIIIDDEESLTRLLKIALEDSGNYSVETESNPLNAIDRIWESQPQAIILDILMPQKTGLEIASELVAHPMLKKIPIIFLSAAVDKDDPSMWKSDMEGIAFKIQNEAYQSCHTLVKPVSAEDIEELLVKILPD